MNQKYWWIVIVILAIIVVGVWVWKLGGHATPAGTGAPTSTPTGGASASATMPSLGADTTGEIQQQLQGTNASSVNNEFNQINQQLNSL